MNPDISWPAGVQPRALLRQEHDKQLLQAEFHKVLTELESAARAKSMRANKMLRVC